MFGMVDVCMCYPCVLTVSWWCDFAFRIQGLRRRTVLDLVLPLANFDLRTRTDLVDVY